MMDIENFFKRAYENEVRIYNFDRLSYPITITENYGSSSSSSIVDNLEGFFKRAYENGVQIYHFDKLSYPITITDESVSSSIKTKPKSKVTFADLKGFVCPSKSETSKVTSSPCGTKNVETPARSTSTPCATKVTSTPCATKTVSSPSHTGEFGRERNPCATKSVETPVRSTSTPCGTPMKSTTSCGTAKSASPSFGVLGIPVKTCNIDPDSPKITGTTNFGMPTGFPMGPGPVIPPPNLLNVNGKVLDLEMGDNNCYLNAIIAFLLKNQMYIEDIISRSGDIQKIYDPEQLLYNMYTHKNVKDNQQLFKKWVKMNDYNKQEDVSEFLRKLLYQHGEEIGEGLDRSAGQLSMLFAINKSPSEMNPKKPARKYQYMLMTTSTQYNNNYKSIFENIRVPQSNKFIAIEINRGITKAFGPMMKDQLNLHIQPGATINGRTYRFAGGVIHSGASDGKSGHYTLVYQDKGKWFTYNACSSNEIVEITQSNAFNSYPYNLIFYEYLRNPSL